MEQPQGNDYQQGEQYGYATLREAVFARDNYTCICCGKSAVKDGVILKIHHLGYLTGDRSSRMANLGSVCDGCHTSKNHKPGGRLYGLKPTLKSFKGAAFMTMVRYSMIEQLENTTPDVDIQITYGLQQNLQEEILVLRKRIQTMLIVWGHFIRSIDVILDITKNAGAITEFLVSSTMQNT